jgi:hypothetical protein
MKARCAFDSCAKNSLVNECLRGTRDHHRAANSRLANGSFRRSSNGQTSLGRPLACFKAPIVSSPHGSSRTLKKFSAAIYFHIPDLT